MKTSSTTNTGTLSLIVAARKVRAAGIIATLGGFLTSVGKISVSRKSRSAERLNWFRPPGSWGAWARGQPNVRIFRASDFDPPTFGTYLWLAEFANALGGYARIGLKRRSPVDRAGNESINDVSEQGMTFIRKFFSEESAATAVEYAVILALLLMAMFSMIILLGTSVKGVWQSNSSQISSALGSAS